MVKLSREIERDLFSRQETTRRLTVRDTTYSMVLEPSKFINQTAPMKKYRLGIVK